MAKRSAIEKNARRSKLAKRIAGKRTRLKAIAVDRDVPPEERFAAQLKLAELPRNSSETRVRNRCSVTGRPRGYYRKFKLSRIALRELASSGQIPGMVKSSWYGDPDDNERSSWRYANADSQWAEGSPSGRCFTRLEVPG